MSRDLALAGVLCLPLLSAVCAGQVKGTIHGNVFREPGLGLTYEFPEKFSSKLEGESPIKGSQREHMILTLWETPESGGALRMAFLYDTMQRSRDRTHDTIALAYLGEIKRMWLGVKGVSIAGPAKVLQPSYDYWRMDFSGPDQVPRYSSAIVITLADRRVLVVRAGASSQSELDSEIDSLAGMRFDKSQK
jgi:hypothetical protein